MVSAGMQLVKYLLFIFNFVFFVSGIAILVVGALVQANYKQYLGFVGNHFVSAPILLIVVGCVVTIIAFFGCCGAIKESHCMMLTFSVLLAIIFVLELAGGIAAYVFRNDLEKLIDDEMVKGIKNYTLDKNDVLSRTWDAVQHDFDCCGFNGSADWHKLNTKFGAGEVPDSCCEKDKEGCGKDPSAKKYEDGCGKKFYKSSDHAVYIVGAVGIGIAFIQIIGIIFACCLASAIKREYEVV